MFTLNTFLASVTDKAEEIQAPASLPTGKYVVLRWDVAAFGIIIGWIYRSRVVWGLT